MKFLIFVLVMNYTINDRVIFDFQPDVDLSDWRVIDDIVMGGRSAGSFELNSEGHGLYKGYVSLENNGGFSSISYRFPKKTVKNFTKVKLVLKGDGKKYQFRIKENASDYYSYIAVFETDGTWQEISIPLNDMYPTFRGRNLDMPNFSNDSIEQIAFLISNKKAESFQLLIDRIELE